MFRKTSNIIYFVLYAVIAKADGNYRFDYAFNKEAKGWLKFHRVPATFNNAFLHCKLEGAVLASPLNDNIQKAMVKMQAASGVDCGIYTGIHATISQGDFTSIEGIPLAKIQVTWAPDQPDNFENEENCIMMLRNGSVADTRCNETYPYMCYRSKIASPMITSCGTVDNGYNLDSRTGSCYKFQRIGKTWRRAQTTCFAEGGYLAIINSATEALVINEIFAKHPAATIVSEYKDSVALGFLDWDSNGSWYTVNGQSLEEAGFSTWLAARPSKPEAKRHCGSLFRSGQLDDVWCENFPLAFICEKAPGSLVLDDIY